MRPLCSIIIALCSLSVFGNDLSTTIEELCRDIPEGTYTLSIVRSEYAAPAYAGTGVREKLSFSHEPSVFLPKRKLNPEAEKLWLDYLCQIDSNAATPIANFSAQLFNLFETEQTITGRIEGDSKKLNNFKLNVMVPSLGLLRQTEVSGRLFKLSGLEFVDGTLFNLQVQKENGKDGSLSLHVDEPKFPKISVKKYHHSQWNGKQTPEYFKEKARLADMIDAIDLPEITVKERRAKPMNFRHMDPDRTIAENDPIFEKSPTLEMVVSRFGLKKGFGWVPIEGQSYGSDNLIYIETIGFIKRGFFTPCEIMLNEHLLSDYDLSDILLIDPKTIKQIEYFMPSNYEMFGNLYGTRVYGDARDRGLLMIWTKSPVDFSYYRMNRPSSLATIKPLGYTAPKEFNFSRYSTNPTLYWNPKFSPSSPMAPRLDHLETFGNIVVRIEGISDNGDIINKRKRIRDCLTTNVNKKEHSIK
ncbi:MAG: hypothetical protein NC339_06315 [Muribaculaceae bacterium]|nr:hypothetical protein [Muribaculaceae bacterium]